MRRRLPCTARERGARVRLEVRISHAGAPDLCRRDRFVVVGRRPRYYGHDEDALLLEHPRHREVMP